MSYNLTGQKVSLTYANLLQYVDGSFYNGLGVPVNIDTSGGVSQYYVDSNFVKKYVVSFDPTGLDNYYIAATTHNLGSDYAVYIYEGFNPIFVNTVVDGVGNLFLSWPIGTIIDTVKILLFGFNNFTSSTPPDGSLFHPLTGSLLIDFKANNLEVNSSINMQNNRIVNLAMPVNASDAVNKRYVDSSLDNKIPYTGATADVYLGAHSIFTLGTVGVNTLAPSKQLEVNSPDGNNLRLTYNDNNGSPANYTDFDLNSIGSLTITPTGGLVTMNSSLYVRNSVGIGQPTPNYTLDVSGNFHTTGAAKIDGSIYSGSTIYGAGLKNITNYGSFLTDGQGIVLIANQFNTNGGLGLAATNATSGIGFLFGGTSGTEVARFQGTTGNFGIGQNNPLYKLDVSGNFHTTGSTIHDTSVYIKTFLGVGRVPDTYYEFSALKLLTGLVTFDGGGSLSATEYYTGANNIKYTSWNNASEGVQTTLFLTKVGPGGSGSQSGGNLRLGYGAVDSSLYRLDVSGNMHITGVLVVDGSIDLNNQIIHDVASPIDGSDATNKNYVDTAITKTIGLTLNGNGAVLTSGSKGFKEIDNNYTIKGWSLYSDISGNISIDIKSCNYTTYPTTLSINASTRPSLTNALKNKDASLVGWVTNVSTGDLLEFVVDTSITNVTKIWLTLTLQKR